MSGSKASTTGMLGKLPSLSGKPQNSSQSCIAALRANVPPLAKPLGSLGDLAAQAALTARQSCQSCPSGTCHFTDVRPNRSAAICIAHSPCSQTRDQHSPYPIPSTSPAFEPSLEHQPVPLASTPRISDNTSSAPSLSLSLL